MPRFGTTITPDPYRWARSIAIDRLWRDRSIRERGEAALDYLLVGLGSALGGMARYGAGLGAARWLGTAFPWGTLAINVLGSLGIGWASAALAASSWRLLIMVGLCGGFTTFSAFSLQTLLLARHGQIAAAAGNIALSVVLCLGATALGSRL